MAIFMPLTRHLSVFEDRIQLALAWLYSVYRGGVTLGEAGSATENQDSSRPRLKNEGL
jgi:hypothetical protein